jgi:HEPN domain-containing protein
MTNDEFNLWFSEAQNDFDVGKILFRKKKYNAASFHFVQAAEKAIKALLYYFNQKPWGHSILKLLEAYEEFGKKVPKEIKITANTLDPHYINTRYPDAFPGYNPMEYYTQNIAKEIRVAAQEILNFANNEKETMNANGSI